MFNYRATPVPINPNWKELVSSLVSKRNQMQLSQEALAYKDTKDIKCYKLNERLKHLVALYELENPSVED